MNITRGPRSCRLRQIVSRGVPRIFILSIFSRVIGSRVIDQNLFFIHLVNELYAVHLNRLLYRHRHLHIHKDLANYRLLLTTL